MDPIDGGNVFFIYNTIIKLIMLEKNQILKLYVIMASMLSYV